MSKKKEYTTSIIGPDGVEHEIDFDKVLKFLESKSEGKKSQDKTEFLKYDFTHDELHSMGMQLSRLSAEQISLENEKKASASNFKAKIDSNTAIIEGLSGKINSGYEHREVKCIVVFNQPVSGTKTIYRADSWKIVEQVAMTPYEMQTELDGFGN